eukprot:jgi/Chlat1/1305/Chrsp118S01717
MALYPPAVTRRAGSQEGPFFAPHSASEVDLYARSLEEQLAGSRVKPRAIDTAAREKAIPLHELLDITPVLNEGVAAIVDDTFTKCFASNTPEPWNWNWYLFPLWVLGVVMRYGILFPLRLLLLMAGWVVFIITFFPTHFALKDIAPKLQHRLERRLVELMCGVFVASWTGVIRYHGPRPSPRPNQVFVANHTSMIDFVLLEQVTAFAVIMQKHPGWVGLLQTHILSSLGCIWFNRSEAKDRRAVADKIQRHIADPEANPLLIFPEGVCVNNEYCVMFKKGAFELGAVVCPIAIKYNKIFVDAFWNSRKQSFTRHLLRLMTSWAVVADVWYMEPQTLKEGECHEDFANRVQAMIARRAGIKAVQWDGYLKYYRPSKKLTQKRQKAFAESISSYLPALSPVPTSPEDKPGRIVQSLASLAVTCIRSPMRDKPDIPRPPGLVQRKAQQQSSLPLQDAKDSNLPSQ